MNILFICEDNQFRSKLAEMIFNKSNTNKKFISKSAGMFPSGYWFSKDLKRIASEKNLELYGRPKQVNDRTLRWADVIVLTGIELELNEYNLPKQVKQIIKWQIPKVHELISEEKNFVFNKIRNEVNALTNSL